MLIEFVDLRKTYRSYSKTNAPGHWYEAFQSSANKNISRKSRGILFEMIFSWWGRGEGEASRVQIMSQSMLKYIEWSSWRIFTIFIFISSSLFASTQSWLNLRDSPLPIDASECEKMLKLMKSIKFLFHFFRMLPSSTLPMLCSCTCWFVIWSTARKRASRNCKLLFWRACTCRTRTWAMK